MAISGKGDFPISATWWSGRGRGRGREALTKQLTYANGAPDTLETAYGDYFFGAAASPPTTATRIGGTAGTAVAMGAGTTLMAGFSGG